MYFNVMRLIESNICAPEFIKLITKKDKCSASLAFYLFPPPRLVKSIKHEHSCKILYISNDIVHYDNVGKRDRE